MAARASDQDIDRLYQLPLDEFTPARNALAKTAGADASRVRALAKPPIAAWAVNQLYWRNRKIWDALIAAAENARRAHKAVLAGRSGEIRSLSKVHDEAVETALKAALSILTGAGHPQSDATKQAIVTTLRALPAEEAPGRLTHTLQPGGFEALAGLSLGRGVPVAPAKGVAKPTSARAAAAAATAEAPPRPKIDQKAVARARAAIADAEREARDAEQAARREEFEVGKTTRDEARAAKAVERTTAAVAEAQTAHDEAQAALAAAARQRAAAEKRLRAAEDALAAARARAASEQRELQRIEKG